LRGTKFGGGEARAGKNSFPPTPFIFACPSENYQNSTSGFSRKKVRILFKTDNILEQRPQFKAKPHSGLAKNPNFLWNKSSLKERLVWSALI